MIYFFLFVLCVAYIIMDSKFDWDCEFFSTSSILVAIVSLVLGIGTFVSGINEYPKLMSAKAEIETLQRSIDLIKGSRYNVPGGQMIGGSLDNNQIASKYNEYLQKLVEKKSKYNKDLAYDKMTMHMLSMKLFTSSAYYDSKIESLDLLP